MGYVNVKVKVVNHGYCRNSNEPQVFLNVRKLKKMKINLIWTLSISSFEIRFFRLIRKMVKMANFYDFIVS